MAPKGTFDVYALPIDTHGDGSPNEHGLFLRHHISLAELIGDAADKVTPMYSPLVSDLSNATSIVSGYPHSAVCYNPRNGQTVPGMGESTSTQASVAHNLPFSFSRSM